MGSFRWGLSVLSRGRIFRLLGVVALVSLVDWREIFIVSFLTSSIGLLCTVGMRLSVCGGIGCVRILSFILINSSGLTWYFLLFFCSVSRTLLLVVQVLADPARTGEEFRKAWLPYFCRSGPRDTSLEEFTYEVHGWLPLLPEVSLPELTGEMLADVLRRKGATASSLDGWGWRELKVLPVCWFDGLARILSKVEDSGFCPDGLLDACIAMIP